MRLVNLPKKKNIHRDLHQALKGVPGIVNIVPVVSGNEKTRDPVCKGLAFIDFKYHDEAQRYMSLNYEIAILLNIHFPFLSYDKYATPVYFVHEA